MRVFSMGLRGLLRRPVYTVTAVLTLALGVGATAAVFSVLNALLLAPLPYRDPARLVAVWPNSAVANREVDGLRTRARTLEAVAGFSPGWLMGLTGVTEPRQLNAARVSGNLFDMLGVRATAGRTFGMEAETPGNDRLAVLSHDVWQQIYGGDESIVGGTMRLDGTLYTVAGVMPPGFQMFDVKTDLWTPLTMDRDEFTWTGATTLTYGRLTPGVTVAQARAELDVLADGMRVDFGHPDDWAAGADVVGLKESLVGGVRLTLAVLFGAVAFLLLIAVANVTNLLLVRVAERRQELAVRVSLGATPSVIARLLAGESIVLGLLGGGLGVALAYAAVGVLRRILPANLPRVAEIGVNGPVLLMAAGVTLIVVLCFGLAPLVAGSGSGAALAGSLREGRTMTRGRRLRGALIAVEVGLALVLAVGASLMSRTLVSLHDVDPGLAPDHLLTMQMQPLGNAGGRQAFWEEVFREVNALPGVVSSAAVLHLPLSGRSWGANVEIEGHPQETGASPPRAAWQAVSTGFFRTAGVTLLAGRGFEDTDQPGTPLVAVINRAFQDARFAGADPIGMRVRLGYATSNEWATVVGVVEGIRHDSLNAAPRPEAYLPLAQRTVGAMALMVRVTADPMALAPAIRSRIWGIDPNVPIANVRTMDEVLAGSLARQRLVLRLLGVFAGLGLVLGAVGIYGVVAFGVRLRTREIGIRMALGADMHSIVRLVVGQGMRYALAGVVFGVPAALLLSRTMRGLVFGVSPADPLSFGVVLLVLLLVAAAASWIPARRAAACDPTDVLRE